MGIFITEDVDMLKISPTVEMIKNGKEYMPKTKIDSKPKKFASYKSRTQNLERRFAAGAGDRT